MTRPLTIVVLLTLAVVLLRLRVVGWGRRPGAVQVPYPPEGDDGLLLPDPLGPWPSLSRSTTITSACMLHGNPWPCPSCSTMARTGIDQWTWTVEP